MLKSSLIVVVTALTLPLLAAAAPATYAIDPSHTSVMFEALHFGTSTNRGRLQKASGVVEFDAEAKTGKVDLTLDMDAINTGIAPFNNELKGSDFFDVSNHPTAHFVSDGFRFNGDKVVEVTGKLTLRGQTHPVTLKALRFNCYDHPMLKRQVCGGDFEATIQRSQWGVNWGLKMGVADATRLTIQVEAIKQ